MPAPKKPLPIPSLPLPPLILSLRPKQKPLLPLPPPKTIRLRPKKLPPLRNNAVPALPDELFLTEKKDLSRSGKDPLFVFRGGGFAGYAGAPIRRCAFLCRTGAELRLWSVAGDSGSGVWLRRGTVARPLSDFAWMLRPYLDHLCVARAAVPKRTVCFVFPAARSLSDRE